ncbi:hypothetical protein [Halospeciosus flavus]|uniref:Uncharacterized protein n=1 Tax=Halospeciosus flavus TaxID=3032283 RepID=A0ABD5Z2U0_9EURY|nr:hypothetical protein [Halospeciosus flavus]
MNDTPIAEIELTDDHFDFLFNAGASPKLIEVVTKTLDELPSTVNRNSARSEVQKYVKWGNLDGSVPPEEFSHIGGHFFTALWNGDLYEAFCRADLNNRKILLDVFGERRINTDRPDHRHPTVGQLGGVA